MSEAELLRLLDELRKLPHETDWVEFKEANDNYDFRKLGKYFSALANEANLKNQPCGWLVFGVVNKDRSLCGSQFKRRSATQWIARDRGPGVETPGYHRASLREERHRAATPVREDLAARPDNPARSDNNVVALVFAAERHLMVARPFKAGLSVRRWPSSRSDD